MKIDVSGIEFGYEVVDTVTGFAGTATAVASYVTGCAQILVQPAVDEKGGYKEAKWFDHTRLNITGKNEAVMKLGRTESDKAKEGKRVGGPGDAAESAPIR